MSALGPPRRIAFVVTRSDTIGGSSVHIRDMATELTRDGWSVTVMSGGEGVFAEHIRSRGIPNVSIESLVRAIDPLADWRAYRQLRRELAAFRPDLVSLHTAKAGWLGRMAARDLGAPVLYTPHGWPFADGVPWMARYPYLAAERLAAPATTRFVNVCEDDRRTALARGVGREAQHVVVHNGMPDVAPSLRAEPRTAPPRLIMLARFEGQKDHATLIEALRPLVDRPWTLELLGSGSLRPQVEAHVERAGLSDRVIFGGRRDDVAERLAEAQAFVLSSHWEGFPRSILEAMRAGLPVVATDVAGVSEAVVDGRTGFVAPPQDVAGWTERLGAVLDDAELRATMGEAGRRRYEERFTFDAMYAATRAVYEESLAATPKRP